MRRVRPGIIAAAGRGSAGHGAPGLGEVRQGRPGSVRRGTERPGSAGHAGLRLGSAGHGAPELLSVRRQQRSAGTGAERGAKSAAASPAGISLGPDVAKRRGDPSPRARRAGGGVPGRRGATAGTSPTLPARKGLEGCGVRGRRRWEDGLRAGQARWRHGERGGKRDGGVGWACGGSGEMNGGACIIWVRGGRGAKWPCSR